MSVFVLMAKKISIVSLLALTATLLFFEQNALAQTNPNLIPNPSLENSASGTTPDSWLRGRWGTNTAVFRYPVTGTSGPRAAEVEITQYSSGDAKWYFNEVPIQGGATYFFSDQYSSNVTTFVTVQYRLSDGSLRWVDLGTPAPSSGWQNFQKTFIAPSNATHLTIFHLIKRVGKLQIDNYSLTKTTSTQDPNVFSQGFVSLDFDDGWKTTYQNAPSILASRGFKGTWYIITGRFSFPAYVTASEVLDLFSKGHEIGAHTRTHNSPLPSLSDEQKRSEIEGSRQDLLSLGISPVTSFAYPFGAYDSSTDTIVRQAGFTGARTSDGGFNMKTGNRFLLKRQPVEAGTTISQIKAWIDQAKAQKIWLILVFHRVDDSGTQYAATPQVLRETVDYLAAQGVPVRTAREGITLMSQ